jgi:hypothetical protein
MQTERDYVGPVMELADDTSRCTAYLMGNHTIAERIRGHRRECARDGVRLAESLRAGEVSRKLARPRTAVPR